MWERRKEKHGRASKNEIAVLVGRQDSEASCVSFSLPPPNMSQLSSLQWLLLFNFPRPSRSRSGCSLSARRARSQRLCPSSGLHVHFKASPLSSHCSSRPGGCYLFTDGTCSPGMPPLHPSQVKEPWVFVFSVEVVLRVLWAKATIRKRC